MPILNPEILFEVGKMLVENGDSDAVIRFALLGKESLQTMKKIFGSVTFLQLYKDHFVIGWEKKCCTFNFEKNEFCMKALLDQTGKCIRYLHIEERIPIYEPIIDKMIENKHMFLLELHSFSAGINCDKELTDYLLSNFSSTLKNVCIPSSSLTPTIRDTLKLDTLSLLDSPNNSLKAFCCKTLALELQKIGYDFPSIFDSNASFFELLENSPYLVCVKELILHEGDSPYHPPQMLDGIMTHFPSLHILECNMEITGRKYMSLLISLFIKKLKEATEVPSKVKFSFYKVSKMDFPNLVDCKEFCKDFVYIESIPDFYCFRKTIQSAGSDSTLFEVKFPK